MTAASARQQALDVADQLHVMGPVEVGRFFGGAGLALDGRQFGFVMKGDLYLRVDDRSRPDFENRGEGPFTYRTRYRTVTVASYYRVPDDVAASPDELSRWAVEALRAAQAARAATREGGGPATR
jgi:TfoX/Sxy family transcriptional regulator of competence genes